MVFKNNNLLKCLLLIWVLCLQTIYAKEKITHNNEILELELVSSIKSPAIKLSIEGQADSTLKWFGECTNYQDKNGHNSRYCARVADAKKDGNEGDLPKLCLYFDQLDSLDNSASIGLMHVNSVNPYTLKPHKRVSIHDLGIGFKYFEFDFDKYGDYVNSYMNVLKNLAESEKDLMEKTRINRFYFNLPENNEEFIEMKKSFKEIVDLFKKPDDANNKISPEIRSAFAQIPANFFDPQWLTSASNFMSYYEENKGNVSSNIRESISSNVQRAISFITQLRSMPNFTNLPYFLGDPLTNLSDNLTYKPISCYDIELPKLSKYCLMGNFNDSNVVAKTCYLEQEDIDKYQNNEISENQLQCKYADKDLNTILSLDLTGIASPLPQDLLYPVFGDVVDKYKSGEVIDYPGRGVQIIMEKSNVSLETNLKNLSIFLYYKYALMNNAGELSKYLGCSKLNNETLYSSKKIKEVFNNLKIEYSAQKNSDINSVCNIIKDQKTLTSNQFLEIMNIYDSNLDNGYDEAYDILKIIDYYFASKYYTSNKLYNSINCDDQIKVINQNGGIANNVCEHIPSAVCSPNRILELCKYMDNDRRSLRYVKSSNSTQSQPAEYFYESIRLKSPEELGLCNDIVK